VFLLVFFQSKSFQKQEL